MANIIDQNENEFFIVKLWIDTILYSYDSYWYTVRTRWWQCTICFYWNQTLSPLGYPNKDIWSYLFVLTSLLLSWRLNDGRGKQSFELQLKQLIKSISNMMLYTSDNTLVAQVRGHTCLLVVLICVYQSLTGVSVFICVYQCLSGVYVC